MLYVLHLYPYCGLLFVLFLKGKIFGLEIQQMNFLFQPTIPDFYSSHSIVYCVRTETQTVQVQGIFVSGKGLGWFSQFRTIFSLN